MSNTMLSEYYWRARTADTNHQNTISGREDHQSRTQCHQKTIGGRVMPTPIIRILLAGGRTTKVEHSAIRKLLAGAKCRHQSSEYYERAGGPRKPNTVPSEYYWRARNADTNHQNTISGREDHQRGTQCHQNTISGREDHPSGYVKPRTACFF